MIIRIFFYSLFLFIAEESNGQSKQTTSHQQVWAGYFNQTRFSKKWGGWLDLHLRTKADFFKDLSQTIVRPGLIYYVNDATKIAAGYAYIRHFPADNHSKVLMIEHRPWQQFQWHTKYARTRTMQWIRLEERYREKVLNDSTIGDGYNFNFRVRYNFLWQVPIINKPISKGDFSFILNDEIHVNFGDQIINNYFDQNRFFAGLSYQTNVVDNLQFGYMNLFQQLPSGNRYKSIHAFRFFYFHNLDLRKKVN